MQLDWQNYKGNTADSIASLRLSVWRISLAEEDRIKMTEDEVQGHWGLGVFLTVDDKCAPWSLTQ